MDQPEEPEQQEPVTPAPRRRGRPKKVREEGGGGASNVTPRGVTSNVTPRDVMSNISHPQALSTGFWMGLLTPQREMELEAKRDKYKRFSLA